MRTSRKDCSRSWTVRAEPSFCRIFYKPNSHRSPPVSATTLPPASLLRRDRTGQKNFMKVCFGVLTEKRDIHFHQCLCTFAQGAEHSTAFNSRRLHQCLQSY